MKVGRYLVQPLVHPRRRRERLPQTNRRVPQAHVDPPVHMILRVVDLLQPPRQQLLDERSRPLNQPVVLPPSELPSPDKVPETDLPEMLPRIGSVHNPPRNLDLRRIGSIAVVARDLLAVLVVVVHPDLRRPLSVGLDGPFVVGYKAIKGP